MGSDRIQSNTSERVWSLLLDSAGDKVPGLTGGQLNMLTLTRKSDGKYWNGAAWQTNSTLLRVTEYDATNSPGLYYYDTPPLPEDVYVTTVDTVEAANVPKIGELKAGDYVDNLDVAVSSRSSHDDPDPSGYIDVAISTRSSHAAADVWSVATRTLTGFGTLIADIWGYVTRRLTAGTKDSEIDAIKAKTDYFPADTGLEINKLLALGGINLKLYNTTYGPFGNLTVGKLRGYASSADLEADQNHLFELDVAGVYTGPNRATTFIRKEAP